MTRLKTCLWSLATLGVCGSYVFIWFRHSLDDSKTLMAAVLAGVVALASLLYSVVGPTAHLRLTKILVGCGALVATFCAGSFLFYGWTERVRLQELGILPFFALICLLSLGTALVAWVTFWRCKWSATAENASA